MDKFNLPQLISFISIILSVVYRITKFNKIKKYSATKEGRDYIATKGSKSLLALEAHIFVCVIIFLLVFVLKLNLAVTVLFQIALWSVSVTLQRKFKYLPNKV